MTASANSRELPKWRTNRFTTVWPSNTQQTSLVDDTLKRCLEFATQPPEIGASQHNTQQFPGLNEITESLDSYYILALISMKTNLNSDS